MEQAEQSRFYRNYWVRLEREPGSHLFDCYTPTTGNMPGTIGITDLIAIKAEIDRAIADFQAEQAQAATLVFDRRDRAMRVERLLSGLERGEH